MSSEGKKRSGSGNDGRAHKKRKGTEKYRKNKAGDSEKAAIGTGDSGVFLSCDMGKEAKCIADALDIFSQMIDMPEGRDTSQGGDESDEPDNNDIEAQIRKEVEGLRPQSTKGKLIQAIKLEIPCLIFLRIDKSIDPVDLVHRICVDAQSNPTIKRSRWIRRMTPITSIRKTLSVDMAGFAEEILKPHFHAGQGPKKFAIRPNIRSNNTLKRDDLIKTIASVVGPEHKVDLTNYDLMILVDVFRNVIGMSVVGSDYDKLKRFNLAELYHATANPDHGPE